MVNPSSDRLAVVMGRVECALERLPDTELRVAHITEAAAVSARTLYRAFARHRGVPPIASLRRSRLEEMRRRLEAGAAEATVTSVALDCGFSHLGRLAAYYRRCFGERPSETLRRARGACRGGRAATWLHLALGVASSLA
jgi:transcriptional regulator GlxA family with amidase domain